MVKNNLWNMKFSSSFILSMENDISKLLPRYICFTVILLGHVFRKERNQQKPVNKWLNKTLTMSLFNSIALFQVFTAFLKYQNELWMITKINTDCICNLSVHIYLVIILTFCFNKMHPMFCAYVWLTYIIGKLHAV